MLALTIPVTKDVPAAFLDLPGGRASRCFCAARCSGNGLPCPAFPGSDWIGPIFAVVIFLYGGVPLPSCAWRSRSAPPPARDDDADLSALAIEVSPLSTAWPRCFFQGSKGSSGACDADRYYVAGTLDRDAQRRQASGALGELAKLMPDAAERIGPDDNTIEVPVGELKEGDRVLVARLASPSTARCWRVNRTSREAMVHGRIQTGGNNI